MKIGLQTWGSEGDVQPFIALSEGLVRAGHEVTLVFCDEAGRDYKAAAEHYGFKLISIHNPFGTSADHVSETWRQLIEMGNPLKQARLILEAGFDPVVDPMYEAAIELCKNNDAVVSHFFVYPLHVAAEKAGVPLAKVHAVHNCLPSSTICPPGIPDLGQWMHPPAWQLVKHMVNRVFLWRINSLRSRAGLKSFTDVTSQAWNSDTLNLIAVSPSICTKPFDWSDTNFVCGFLKTPPSKTLEVVPPELTEFLDAGAPPVYFTFGSMLIHSLDYIKATVEIWTEAVRLLGCRAVFQIAWEDLSIFETGENVFKVARSPHKIVFPRCAAIVHHGGSGTTQSSLTAGKPSVVVAHMADQFFWGAELERLGAAGRTCKRKGLKAKDLASSIAQVLQSQLAAKNAADLGRKMESEDGVKEAVKLIESRLVKSN